MYVHLLISVLSICYNDHCSCQLLKRYCCHICRHRNSYEHNLCVDMLKEGFHQSFCEMFGLMSQQRKCHEMLGTESGLQEEPLIHNQPEKLDQLKYHLTAAETAKRRGIYKLENRPVNKRRMIARAHLFTHLTKARRAIHPTCT